MLLKQDFDGSLAEFTNFISYIKLSKYLLAFINNRESIFAWLYLHRFVMELQSRKQCSQKSPVQLINSTFVLHE